MMAWQWRRESVGQRKRPGSVPGLSISELRRRLLFETVFCSCVLLAGGEIAIFVGFKSVHGHVFTRGLASGFVSRAGDVDGDRHCNFRVQGEGNSVNANRLDR